MYTFTIEDYQHELEKKEILIRELENKIQRIEQDFTKLAKYRELIHESYLKMLELYG
jgi:chromosome segregation ATPase